MEGIFYEVEANFPEGVDDTLEVAEEEEEEQEDIEGQGIEQDQEEELEEEPDERQQEEEKEEVEEDYDYDYDDYKEEDEKDGDGVELRSLQNMMQQMQLISPILSPFLCNICVDYVRNGVITICGHLFCWTCLWTALYSRPRTRCPCCRRRLLLHEDVVPFMSDGPNAGLNDNGILAQPGDVPRPSGLYLQNECYPAWFTINGNMNALSAPERKLARVFRQVHTAHPLCMRTLKVMQWVQLISVLCIIYYWIINLLL